MTIDEWFDTDQFTIPQQYTFGNVGRVLPTVRGDFVKALDFSLFKDNRFHDGKWNAQNRIEAFNLLNSFSWSNPVTDLSSGQFGRITDQAGAPRIMQFGIKYGF